MESSTLLTSLTERSSSLFTNPLFSKRFSSFDSSKLRLSKDSKLVKKSSSPKELDSDSESKSLSNMVSKFISSISSIFSKTTSSIKKSSSRNESESIELVLS